MDSDQLDRDIGSLLEALNVLASDIDLAAKLSHNGDTQFARRVYIRAVFALFEGNLNLMSDLVMRASERHEIVLNDSEREILSQAKRWVNFGKRIGRVFEAFSRLFPESHFNWT